MKVLSIAALFLLGCGGSSSAALYLFDAPAGVEAVNITIASMDAHVAGDEAHDGEAGGEDDGGEWQTLEVGQTLNLMAYQGEAGARFLGDLALPEGKVTQLRLRIDVAGENTAVVDGESCDLDLSVVDQRGIKINHPFKAFASADGDRHEVFVHFDLEQSLSPLGSCFLLSPRIELVKVKTDGREVRL